MPDSAPIQPISTQEGLTPLLEAFDRSSEVYMDTEADSLHHYFEKICLLQFTCGTAQEPRTFLVDPLASLDYSLIFASLKNKPLVLHGADYDLRLLKADFDFVPVKIFDTMLAARLAGHSRMGLDALVEHYVGEKLDHSAQKADWSQRPLPERLLRYAVSDTKHLPLITQKLRQELQELGRTEWHRQQCQQLIESSMVSNKNTKETWRIKGSFDLDRRSLSILKELWHWRDQEARNWDRPSYMVCSNEKLLELTNWAKTHPDQDILQGPALPKRWPPRRYHSLKETLRKAWALPMESWPEKSPRGVRPPFDPQFTKRFDRLRFVRNEKAKSLNLDPAILAPNAVLESIAAKNPKNLDDLETIERWLPWQKELLGRIFIEALASETTSSEPMPSGLTSESSP